MSMHGMHNACTLEFLDVDSCRAFVAETLSVQDLMMFR